VDVIVMDEALAQRRSKVRGTMVDRALREGRVLAESEFREEISGGSSTEHRP
jgi:hypothetical protein